eukprot:1142870-Pleurochrysis_carterae.AAC.1
MYRYAVVPSMYRDAVVPSMYRYAVVPSMYRPQARCACNAALVRARPRTRLSSHRAVLGVRRVVHTRAARAPEFRQSTRVHAHARGEGAMRARSCAEPPLWTLCLRRVEQHLGELRVERELGHHGAELGQIAVVVQGACAEPRRV